MDALSYIVPGAFVLLMAAQVAPAIRTKLMRGKPAPDFNPLLSANQRGRDRFLIYFHSPGCIMCRAMTPVIDRLAAVRDDVIKVDAAASLDVARGFGIRGTPTTVLVRDGRIERVLVGAKTESQIRALLERL